MDHIKNKIPKTPKALKVPQKRAPALDTGNCEVLRSSKLDNTFLACQGRDTGKLTFGLIHKAEMVLVAKEKRITTRTMATLEKITITHVSAFSGLRDHPE